MDYLIIALIALALGTGIGFVLGLKSKAMAKIKARKEKKFDIQVDQALYEKALNNLPGHKAPPPPARIIKEGSAPPKPKSMKTHLKPSSLMYDSDTFVRVRQCKNCKTIGDTYTLYSTCKKCGGNTIILNSAAKWVNDKWVFSDV